MFVVCPVTSTAPNYRVLDTDYTGYSIVYNCHTVLGLFKTGITLPTLLSKSWQSPPCYCLQFIL